MESHASLAAKSFEKLSQTAFRHEGAVTWIGVSQGRRASVGAIGPEFYSGTSGVAFALAHFAAHTSSEEGASLARGAMEHALTRASDVAPDKRLGFYAGWPGIIYAACIVAEKIGDDGLLSRARDLAAALGSEAQSDEFDVTSGVAGAVAGLALVAPVLGADTLETAIDLAETLRSTAVQRPRQLRGAWRSSREKGYLPLTGFAHGSAGVAWALLELWALHPDAGWLRDLAFQAFDYEDRTYDHKRNYWPDLRHYRNRRTVELLPPPSQAAWCHGPGGMSLARLRAFELTLEDRLRNGAVQMAHQLAAESRHGAAESVELGLCHGLPGNAVILSQVADATGLPELRGMAQDLRTSALEQIGQGTQRPRLAAVNAGLMLGEAGQLLFFVHVSGGIIVSPLLPRPALPV